MGDDSCELGVVADKMEENLEPKNKFILFSIIRSIHSGRHHIKVVLVVAGTRVVARGGFARRRRGAKSTNG
jgi:hypothetical protein